MIPQNMIAYGRNECLIRAIAADAARRAAELGPEHVYNFTIGNPSVPAPACVRETIEDLLLHTDPVELHGYTPAPGDYGVRRAVAEYLNQTHGMVYPAEAIYMTSGAAACLAICLRALLLPGEEVVTLTPYFSEYRVYTEAAGGVLREVPSDPDTFQIDQAALQSAVHSNTKVILLNSPNNPSGVVLREDSLRTLCDFLREKEAEYGHSIYLLSDEPYRDLTYDGVTVPYLPKLYRDTLVCNSFSKSLTLPGERIGFIAVSNEMPDYEEVNAAVGGAGRALGYICASSLFQRVVARCLGRTADTSVYQQNRDLLYHALPEMGYRCVRPDGAFYLFVRTPEPDAVAFCQRAKEYELFLVPGDDFGCPGYVRLAYCVATDMIARSLPAFRALAASYGL
ncbi:MAG: pyridoxal phosphate-dependent aminotransferase [Oscillospiraceae bacterium]|nr:pyridoxal phosphate-dependent aminotransferase [Oscillospiraceae bacterium]